MRPSLVAAVAAAVLCAAGLEPVRAADPQTESAVDARLLEAKQLISEAKAAREQRDEKKAIALYEQALTLSEAALGAEHNDLVPILDELGALNSSMRSYVAALRYYERSLAIDEKTRGP